MLNFLSKHYKAILSFSSLLLLGILIKKKFYNRLVPPSDVLAYVNKQAFEKVVLGSVFMVGYFKSPELIAKHGSDYVIANRSLLED